MNLTMVRDARKKEEGVGVQLQGEEKKNGGSFSEEFLVASLERNSRQAQVQIFLVQLVKTRAFTCTFPYGQTGLSFIAWSNSCE